MSLDTFAPALRYVLDAADPRGSAADQHELLQSTRVEYRKFLARMGGHGRQAAAGRGAVLTKEVLTGGGALVTTEAVATRFDDSNAMLWLVLAGGSSAVSLHLAGLELLGVLDTEHGNGKMLEWAKRQQAAEVQARVLEREAAAKVTRAVQRSTARSRYVRRQLLLHSHSDCKTAARHAHAQAMGIIPLWWWRSRHIPLSLGAGCGLDSHHGRDQLGARATAEPRHRRGRRLRHPRSDGALTIDLPVRDYRGQSGFVTEVVVPVQLPGSSIPWHMCGRAFVATGQPGCQRCCVFEFDGRDLPGEAIGLPINDAKGSALRELLDDIGVRGGLAGLGLSKYLLGSDESPPKHPLPLSAGKAASLVAHSVGTWVQQSCPDKQFRVDFAASGSTTAIATRIRRALSPEPLWRLLTVTVEDDLDLPAGFDSLHAVLLDADGQEHALGGDLLAERPSPPYPSHVSAQNRGGGGEVDMEAESEGSRLVSYSDGMDHDICTVPTVSAAPSAAAKHEWRVSQALLEVPDGRRVSAVPSRQRPGLP